MTRIRTRDFTIASNECVCYPWWHRGIRSSLHSTPDFLQVWFVTLFYKNFKTKRGVGIEMWPIISSSLIGLERSLVRVPVLSIFLNFFFVFPMH